MIRKQIYIEEQTNEHLKKMARSKKMSEASLIREAIKLYLAGIKGKKTYNPLNKLAGLCDEGKIDSSTEHDRYLYGREING